MLTLSFCTTCMGRRAHVEKTLPYTLALLAPFAPHAELVLVDYNSADGLEDYVRTRHLGAIRTGVLSYYRTTEPTHYHPAHAKNVAHRAARGELLFNLDADNAAAPGLVEFLQDAFAHNPRRIAHGALGNDTAGRLCLPRADFIALGGYDERLRGYGREDRDLLARARAERGLAPLDMSRFDRFVRHSDRERVEHMDPSVFTRDPDLVATLAGPDAQLYAHYAQRAPDLAAAWLGNVRVLRSGPRAPGTPFGRARLRRNFEDDVQL